MKAWYNGEYVEVYVGQVVTVYRCLGQKIYGELATLTRATKRCLVFTTDSGATVKILLDNLHATVGRVKENGYCVSPRSVEAFSHMVHEEVRFGDKAKCRFVKK